MGDAYLPLNEHTLSSIAQVEDNYMIHRFFSVDESDSCSALEAVGDYEDTDDVDMHSRANPLYFNILLAGDSGIGKSTFIADFLN